MPAEIFIYILPFWLLVLSPSFRQEYFHRDEPDIKQEIKKSGRIQFFDYAKGLAILGVILIHVTYFFEVLGAWPEALTATNFLNNLFRFAIGIFLISSGILLNPNDLNSAKQTWSFYRRKIVRLLIPYLLFAGLVAQLKYPALNLEAKLYLIFSGNLLVPYYFLILLFQLYLLYPLLVRLAKWKYLLEATLLLSLLAHAVPWLWEYTGIVLFPRFLFFFAYGLCLRRFFLDPQTKPTTKWWWLLLVYYLIAALLINDHFYNMRYFYGLAVFHLLWAYQEYLLSGWPAKFFTFIGRRSLFIYLTHFLFVEYFFYFFQSLEWPTKLILTSLCGLISSLALAGAWSMLQSQVKAILTKA
jgi:surface polysaccharide O-acyltransferase-like enzyme